MDAKPDRRSQLGRSLFWLGTRIADIGLWAGAAALLAIVVLNAVNIFLRYFFKMPLSWAEEAMLYLMIFGVYVGAVSVAWQQAHIRIDAVLDFAPPARRQVLEIRTAACLAVPPPPRLMVWEIVSTLVRAAVLLPVAYASFGVVSLLFDFDQV